MRMFFLVAVGLVAVASARASVKASDFFCRDIGVGLPVTVKIPLQTCADAPKRPNNAQLPASICIEGALCTFLDESMQNAKVKNGAGAVVKFSALPTVLKSRYLETHLAPTDWLPSTITCQKVSSSDSRTCPPVDQCKGDINYGMFAADYGPEKNYQYSNTPIMNAPAVEHQDGTEPSAQ